MQKQSRLAFGLKLIFPCSETFHNLVFLFPHFFVKQRKWKIFYYTILQPTVSFLFCVHCFQFTFQAKKEESERAKEAEEEKKTEDAKEELKAEEVEAAEEEKKESVEPENENNEDVEPEKEKGDTEEEKMDTSETTKVVFSLQRLALS